MSRSKIDLFIECPRCFYLDRRLGVGRPPGFPFTLNSAVDTLLKKEFDIHRKHKSPHPLMDKYGIDAIPFQHHDIEMWRDNFVGIQYLHQPTNFIVTGAIDDIWVNKKGELIIVDYKSTSKDEEVNLNAQWQEGYKRQMEVYQWLFRQNGFKVSPTGYFVYANGRKDRQAFDARLEFDVSIIAYTGKTDWVDEVLAQAKKTLTSDSVPKLGEGCDYCPYRDSAQEMIEKAEKKAKDNSRSNSTLF